MLGRPVMLGSLGGHPACTEQHLSSSDSGNLALGGYDLFEPGPSFDQVTVQIPERPQGATQPHSYGCFAMLERPTERCPDVIMLAFKALEPRILLRRAKVSFTALDPVDYSLGMLTAPRVPLAALGEELACVGVYRVEHLEARLPSRPELPYQTVI